MADFCSNEKKSSIAIASSSSKDNYLTVKPSYFPKEHLTVKLSQTDASSSENNSVILKPCADYPKEQITVKLSQTNPSSPGKNSVNVKPCSQLLKPKSVKRPHSPKKCKKQTKISNFFKQCCN